MEPWSTEFSSPDELVAFLRDVLNDVTRWLTRFGNGDSTPIGRLFHGVPAPYCVSGNSIVLDIGAGAYAVYAHLQPGSLTVKEGERVRRGEVLGLVGNTGNSTEPHLHFHMADRPYAIVTFADR